MKDDNDDIVYGEPLPPKITEIKPLENWKLQLTFENGEQRIFNIKPYRYGVFARLEEEDYFKRVRLVDGCPTWPHGQDLHYGMIYKNSRALATKN
jgi:hypothetical protein